ncbi:MAG TPA: hypothetical protein VFO79_17240, partial [Xanthomonadales bacterium]|nr:hypothetical protein [Xanthomonadales bacterium]
MLPSNRRISFRARRGFSMIDVMIAVVVLATGLLALAALQATVVRNAAESKLRSQAATLAQREVETFRTRAVSFTGYENIAPGTTTTTIDTADGLAQSGFTNVASVQVRTTVTRFVADGNVPHTGWVDAATVAAGDQRLEYQPNQSEYKLIQTQVTWTDANGDSRATSITDTVSPVAARTDNPTVPIRPRSSNRVSQPLVVTDKPSDLGVIPIAIGSENGQDRETAATNPKPILTEGGGVLETRFDVLTYA